MAFYQLAIHVLEDDQEEVYYWQVNDNYEPAPGTDNNDRFSSVKQYFPLFFSCRIHQYTFLRVIKKKYSIGSCCQIIQGKFLTSTLSMADNNSRSGRSGRHPFAALPQEEQTPAAFNAGYNPAHVGLSPTRLALAAPIAAPAAHPAAAALGHGQQMFSEHTTLGYSGHPHSTGATSATLSYSGHLPSSGATFATLGYSGHPPSSGATSATLGYSGHPPSSGATSATLGYSGHPPSSGATSATLGYSGHPPSSGATSATLGYSGHPLSSGPASVDINTQGPGSALLGSTSAAFFGHGFQNTSDSLHSRTGPSSQQYVSTSSTSAAFSGHQNTLGSGFLHSQTGPSSQQYASTSLSTGSTASMGGGYENILVSSYSSTPADHTSTSSHSGIGPQSVGTGYENILVSGHSSTPASALPGWTGLPGQHDPSTSTSTASFSIGHGNIPGFSHPSGSVGHVFSSTALQNWNALHPPQYPSAFHQYQESSRYIPSPLPSISSRSIGSYPATEPGGAKRSNRKFIRHNPIAGKGKMKAATPSNPTTGAKPRANNLKKLPEEVQRIIKYARAYFISESLYQRHWFFQEGLEAFETLSSNALSIANNRLFDPLLPGPVVMDNWIRRYIHHSSAHQRGELKDLAVAGVQRVYLSGLTSNADVIRKVGELLGPDPHNPYMPLFARGDNFVDGSYGVWNHGFCCEILGKHLLDGEDAIGSVFPEKWGPSMLPVAASAGFTAIFCGLRHYEDGLPAKSLSFKRADYEPIFLRFFTAIDAALQTQPFLSGVYDFWWQSEWFKYKGNPAGNKFPALDLSPFNYDQAFYNAVMFLRQGLPHSESSAKLVNFKRSRSVALLRYEHPQVLPSERLPLPGSQGMFQHIRPYSEDKQIGRLRFVANCACPEEPVAGCHCAGVFERLAAAVGGQLNEKREVPGQLVPATSYLALHLPVPTAAGHSSRRVLGVGEHTCELRDAADSRWGGGVSLRLAGWRPRLRIGKMLEKGFLTTLGFAFSDVRVHDADISSSFLLRHGGGGHVTAALTSRRWDAGADYSGVVERKPENNGRRTSRVKPGFHDLNLCRGGADS
ncbi:hypothetical protein GALMADRAFT_1364553 [Galerina marginata CBS 339.88]|uniref:DUF6532 domain-containing protein n=1 Tax=Galerina marginata (strain CBS 339.88) TaxID=685588 RepID=A0A067S3X6_GALM3|nr:hypothetical protein GALMADRAFT_1364553 [Galerina marginata CBS 339.88]